MRHSNYVHTGRYVCLAGYPSTLVSLQRDSGGSSSSSSSSGGEDQMDIDELSRDATRRAAATSRSPLNYKLAQAQVLVDDNEGLLQYQLALRASHGKRQEPTTGNFLANMISSNTWIRNVTILLIISCGILALIKLIQIKRQKTTRKTHDGSHYTSNVVSPSLLLVNNIQQTRQQRSDNPTNDNDGNSSELVLNQSVASTRTPISRPGCGGTMRENIMMRNDYIDQSLLKDKLMVCAGLRSDRICDDEHVYSEIGYVDSLKQPKQQQQQQLQDGEPYYKQPRGVISKNVGE